MLATDIAHLSVTSLENRKTWLSRKSKEKK